MIQSHKILLVLALILISGLIWYGADKRSQDSVELETAHEQAEETVSVKLKDGESEIKSFPEVTFSSGDSALSVTRSVVEVEVSGAGETAFVTKIGDREADNNKKEFWLFMINGTPAEVGAGSYLVEDGDTISWEITTY